MRPKMMDEFFRLVSRFIFRIYLNNEPERVCAFGDHGYLYDHLNLTSRSPTMIWWPYNLARLHTHLTLLPCASVPPIANNTHAHSRTRLILHRFQTMCLAHYDQHTSLGVTSSNFDVIQANHFTWKFSDTCKSCKSLLDGILLRQRVRAESPAWCGYVIPVHGVWWNKILLYTTASTFGSRVEHTSQLYAEVGQLVSDPVPMIASWKTYRCSSFGGRLFCPGRVKLRDDIQLVTHLSRGYCVRNYRVWTQHIHDTIDLERVLTIALLHIAHVAGCYRTNVGFWPMAVLVTDRLARRNQLLPWTQTRCWGRFEGMKQELQVAAHLLACATWDSSVKDQGT